MFIRLYTYFCEDAKNSNSIHQRVIRLLFMFTIINKVMLPRNVRVSERSMSTHMGRCYTQISVPRLPILEVRRNLPELGKIIQ